MDGEFDDHGVVFYLGKEEQQLQLVVQKKKKKQLTQRLGLLVD